MAAFPSPVQTVGRCRRFSVTPEFILIRKSRQASTTRCANLPWLPNCALRKLRLPQTPPCSLAGRAARARRLIFCQKSHAFADSSPEQPAAGEVQPMSYSAYWRFLKMSLHFGDAAWEAYTTA